MFLLGEEGISRTCHALFPHKYLFFSSLSFIHNKNQLPFQSSHLKQYLSKTSTSYPLVSGLFLEDTRYVAALLYHYFARLANLVTELPGIDLNRYFFSALFAWLLSLLLIKSLVQYRHEVNYVTPAHNPGFPRIDIPPDNICTSPHLVRI